MDARSAGREGVVSQRLTTGAREEAAVDLRALQDKIETAERLVEENLWFVNLSSR